MIISPVLRLIIPEENSNKMVSYKKIEDDLEKIKFSTNKGLSYFNLYFYDNESDDFNANENSNNEDYEDFIQHMQKDYKIFSTKLMRKCVLFKEIQITIWSTVTSSSTVVSSRS